MTILANTKQLAQRAWQEQDGVLTFEWVLLVTLLAIGIIGGMTAARDAIISELGDIAQALVCIDQSYSVTAYDNESDDCPITAPGWDCPDEPDLVKVCRPGDPPPP